MRIVVNGRFGGLKTGVGRVIENLISNLQHIDRENEYFIYVNKEFKDFIAFENANFHLLSNGVPAANSLLNHLWTQTGFIYSVFKHKADMVILLQINLFVLKAAPTIYMQHDLIEYQIPNQKWYKMLFRKAAIPMSLRLADRVVGVSNNTVNDIRKVFGLRDDKLRAIPNGVDLKLFRRIADEGKDYIRSKYGIRGEFILYAGTLTLPQKNLLRLLYAYKMLIDKGAAQKLVMVGGNGKDANLVFEKVRDLGLEGRVIFTGYVADEELPYFYNCAKAFCFPSIYEGFGLPVLESMACGCPVAASKTSSMPEVGGDAALYFDPMDTREMAEALHRLLVDERLRTQCINKGFEQARRFSWEESARRFLDVINSFPIESGTA